MLVGGGCALAVVLNGPIHVPALAVDGNGAFLETLVVDRSEVAGSVLVLKLVLADRGVRGQLGVVQFAF